MTDTRSTGSTKVQNLRTGLDEDVVQATKDTGRELTPERIPHPVLRLRALNTTLDRYPLLAVDGLSGDEIFSDEHVLLSFGNEDTSVPVRLKDDVGSSTGTTTSTTGCSTASSSWSSTSTWVWESRG